MARRKRAIKRRRKSAKPKTKRQKTWIRLLKIHDRMSRLKKGGAKYKALEKRLWKVSAGG